MLLMKFLDFTRQGLVLFIFVHWLVDLAWLSFVSVVSFRTRDLWGRRVHEAIFVACSLLLVGFGGWFLISGVQLVL
jgi:threonine/homoserine/homoserine lactone efflux protein